MEFSPEKTQAIVFFVGRQPLPGLLELGGQRLLWRSNITYLGIIYDKRLVWHDQFAATIAKVMYLLHAYSPMLTGKLLLRTKVRAYKQLIHPVLTYESPAWSTDSITQRQKLAAQQNKILRMEDGGCKGSLLCQKHHTVARPKDRRPAGPHQELNVKVPSWTGLSKARIPLSGFLAPRSSTVTADLSLRTQSKKKTWTTCNDQFLLHIQDQVSL
ncbi:hypothetical protein D910_05194 [Dendroctonus ponderosae]|uniref:Uncharacterized protein n=1 Tax=Dendroctonus ponderosae TaxID=77166 RepID=U4UCY1_DENPD|nr:hypothetical protein D910_05194 [Dendroctonus ponderosae]